nr:type III toxin-antitoxin system ToxN/AbiQ family toxin [Bacilli bacterium]
MNESLKLVIIDSKYCNYLRKYDYRVPYNSDLKELRPFVGVLFKINNYEYFAPLFSPKPKHSKMKNAIDFICIDGGKYGIINFNNMIPVFEGNYKTIDIEKNIITTAKERRKYYRMQAEELMWISEHSTKIINQAIKLYFKYKENKLPDIIKNRCCNFQLLEEKCREYNEIFI